VSKVAAPSTFPAAADRTNSGAVEIFL
jgi:hypothetical protein